MTVTGPLAGLKVLDLGIITAGAATSQIFADFGADVIKVESTTYTDPFRKWTQIAGGGEGADINSSPPFQSVNRGKRGVAIDLKTAEGRATFLELACVSDLVIENFRRGVLDRLGIGFDALRAVNPRIVLLSLSSQGLAGPESEYISFGSPLEAVGGLMAITGYDTENPLWTGNNVNYPDQLVSFIAPGLALAGLRQRNLTGQAVHVDAPQREAVTSVVGDTVVEYTTTGRVAEPIGNRHSSHAPQGVYPTAGVDEWIAISVDNDASWVALCETLGLDELLNDETLKTLAARRQSHDRLDLVIAAATANFGRFALENSLQGAGVAAAAVATPHEVLGHPQLEALGFPVQLDGDPITQRGFAARFSRTPARVIRAAPRLGEHTREVLAEVLGYDDIRLDELIESRAIYSDSAQMQPVVHGQRNPIEETK
jgi:crotonobetainyl-CoA:carnitine CoA-transferase CaiB-like acyl-CoA transferase